jgi:hypothetical protein
MRHVTILPILLSTALLSACATHAVDNHYGEAWAQMQRAQIFDARAGGDTPVLGMDQIQEMIALRAMRNDVTDRTAIKPAPLINISQSSGGGGGGGGGSQ